MCLDAGRFWPPKVLIILHHLWHPNIGAKIRKKSTIWGSCYPMLLCLWNKILECWAILDVYTDFSPLCNSWFQNYYWLSFIMFIHTVLRLLLRPLESIILNLSDRNFSFLCILRRHISKRVFSTIVVLESRPCLAFSKLLLIFSKIVITSESHD